MHDTEDLHTLRVFFASLEFLADDILQGLKGVEGVNGDLGIVRLLPGTHQVIVITFQVCEVNAHGGRLTQLAFIWRAEVVAVMAARDDFIYRISFVHIVEETALVTLWYVFES